MSTENNNELSQFDELEVFIKHYSLLDTYTEKLRTTLENTGVAKEYLKSAGASIDNYELIKVQLEHAETVMLAEVRKAVNSIK